MNFFIIQLILIPKNIAFLNQFSVLIKNCSYIILPYFISFFTRLLY